MTITIEKKDLFTMPRGYYLAHCISSDFALGAGIAQTFDKIYDMRTKLFDFYSDYCFTGGESLRVDDVLNLVTKEKYYHKPTYHTLRQALEDAKEDCLALHINKLAMPRIGCGLDRLEWNKVYEIICETFEDMDIKIVICEL